MNIYHAHIGVKFLSGEGRGGEEQEGEGVEVDGLKFPPLFPFTLTPTSWCFNYCKLLCNEAIFISLCSQHCWNLSSSPSSATYHRVPRHLRVSFTIPPSVNCLVNTAKFGKPRRKILFF